jgi:hypothetical protein
VTSIDDLRAAGFDVRDSDDIWTPEDRAADARAVADVLAKLADWPADVFALAAQLPTVDQPSALALLRSNLRELDEMAVTLAGQYGPEAAAARSRLSSVRRRVENLLTRSGVRDILTEAAGTRALSWEPDDLEDVLTDEVPKRTPTILRRESDGMGLLYPGLMHLAVSPSFVGKSWVALVAAAQTILSGENVLYLDYESDRAEVVGRLRKLGVPPAAIRQHFQYSARPRGFTVDTARTYFAPAHKRSYALVVVDGVTGGMSTLNLNINDATDVDRWQTEVPRPFAENGAAVLLIGHRSKGSKAGGDPLGSQHWRAGIDGVQFEVDAAAPIVPGARGELRVRIYKDRPAVLLGASQVGTKIKKENVVAASIVLDESAEPGRIAWRVLGPTGEEDRESSDGPFFDPLLLESLRLAITAHPGSTTRELRARVTGAADRITAHLLRLVELGQARVEAKGNSKRYYPSTPAETPPYTGHAIGPEAWEHTAKYDQPDPLNYLPRPGGDLADEGGDQA